MTVLKIDVSMEIITPDGIFKSYSRKKGRQVCCTKTPTDQRSLVELEDYRWSKSEKWHIKTINDSSQN